jgi:hypothetical protein
MASARPTAICLPRPSSASPVGRSDGSESSSIARTPSKPWGCGSRRCRRRTSSSRCAASTSLTGAKWKQCSGTSIPPSRRPEGFELPGATRYAGHAGLALAYEHWASQWDDFRMELQELIDAGNDVVMVTATTERAERAARRSRLWSRMYGPWTMASSFASASSTRRPKPSSRGSRRVDGLSRVRRGAVFSDQLAAPRSPPRQG